MQRKIINLQQYAEGNEGNPNQQGEQNNQSGNGEGNPNNKPKTYTDEEVNKLLNKKFAEWSAKKEREVDEAKKLAEMNAQQQAEYQRDQMKKELDELKNQNALSAMTDTARKMLANEDIHVSDDILELLVTIDAEKTQNAVKSFADLFKNAVKKAVADTLKGSAPNTGGVKTVTKEQIMAIKDRNERQKAINENIELFK